MAEKMALFDGISLEGLADKVDDMREDITELADGQEACRNENAVLEEQVAAQRDEAATKTAQIQNFTVQLEQHQIGLEGAHNKLADEVSANRAELRALKMVATRAVVRDEFELFKDQFLQEHRELKQRVAELAGAVLSVFFCCD